MSDTKRTLPVIAYDHESHRAALDRFTEKVLGAEICLRRGRVLDTFHERMPARDRVPLRHILVDGDRVAGTMGYMPADFLVGGKRVPARFTHDLLVDPEYRGAGLGKLIVAHASGLGDFFPGGMWMTDPCFRIHLACGFDGAALLTTYTAVLDPAKFAARHGYSPVKTAALRAGLGAARAVAQRNARVVLSGSGVSVEEVDRLDPALDATWLQLVGSYDVARVRDSAYLDWKYIGHPHLDYHVLLAKESGGPVGYLVWRPAPEGARERRAVIVDFLVEKGDARTFKRLVARSLADAAAVGSDAVAVLTTQPFAASALRPLGFLASGNRNTWVVAGWRNQMPPEWLKDAARWHVCIGDSDGDIWTGSM